MTAADRALVEAIIQALLFKGEEVEQVSCSVFQQSRPMFFRTDLLVKTILVVCGGLSFLVEDSIVFHCRSGLIFLLLSPRYNCRCIPLMFFGCRSR